ncbi:MAG TPA: hypothetical protein VK358_01490, partial [Longimicrobium sp.]|nr:hypothetical protein [Longimicrobium sp.]
RIEGSFNANDVVLGTQRNGAAAPRQEPAAASGSRQARRDVPWPWHVPTAPARVPLPAEDGPTGEKYVLNLEGARVDGDVYLKSATFHGGVRLVGASVGDAVDLRGATIEGLHGVSLAADRLKTGGTVFLYCTVLHGKAMLQGATVGGNLDMDAVQVQGWNGVAVQANRLHVRGNLKMGDGFAAFGCVDVSYATVDTNWQCRDCTFIAPPDPVRRPWSRAGAQYDDDPGECLAGMGVVVRGTLEMMDGFLSSGIVRLTGISVHQDAILTRASFQSGADRISLRMERADVRGDLSLESSYLDGSVRLSGTRVKGSLRFDGATLAKSLRRVLTPALLDGARLRVGGDVTFIGTMVEFGVSLEGAHIESGLTFKCTNFVKPVRLDARHLRVKGVLAWKPVAVAPDVEVNLADASLGCIEDDGVEGWPGNGGLILDGCEYKTINSDRFGDGPLANEGGAKERLRWLRRQPHPYLPQPYEQLANALRRDGYNNGARKVMMAREAARRREPGMPVRLRALNRLHGAILGYGYRIKWTLVSALVWVALSGVAFDIAYDRGGMHRLKDAVYEAHASDAVLTAHTRSAALSAGVDTAASYPRFQPWVYSLDAFLPIVDLRQQEFWIPNRTMPVWEWFHWCHILLGWIVSTLVVVGVTSMVRKDP